MQNITFVTNNNKEQLSKYEADSENIKKGKYDDDDEVEVAMKKLHSAQEALERELLKLKDVSEDDAFFLDESVDESSNILKTKTPIDQSVYALGDLKTEVDEMIKQKMDLEVQHIALSKAIQYYKQQFEVILEEKKATSLEHLEMMNRLEIAERKAIELKTQYDTLKVTCDEILTNEDVWEVRNSLCKFTSISGIQLLLFVLAVYLLVLKFSSQGTEDVLATT